MDLRRTVSMSQFEYWVVLYIGVYVRLSAITHARIVTKLLDRSSECRNPVFAKELVMCPKVVHSRWPWTIYYIVWDIGVIYGLFLVRIPDFCFISAVSVASL